MIKHQHILHVHPVEKFKIDLFYGNSGVEVFGKPVGHPMDQKRLKKSSLDQYPKDKYQHKDAQQDFEKYFCNFFQT